MLQTTMSGSFSCIPLDLQGLTVNVGVAINESCSYTLTSAILKVDVLCEAMTSTRKVLTTELRCYSFFIYPTGHVRVCEIRLVSNGENRRKPCLECKKCFSNISCTL